MVRISLDIQSDLLRLGVWMVCFWGSSHTFFGGGVWMFSLTGFARLMSALNITSFPAWNDGNKSTPFFWLMFIPETYHSKTLSQQAKGKFVSPKKGDESRVFDLWGWWYTVVASLWQFVFGWAAKQMQHLEIRPYSFSNNHGSETWVYLQ